MYFGWLECSSENKIYSPSLCFLEAPLVLGEPVWGIQDFFFILGLKAKLRCTPLQHFGKKR